MSQIHGINSPLTAFGALIRNPRVIITMKLRLAQVSDILNVAPSSPDAVVTGCSIDSRTVQPGELFFAIRGPRFDGHDFVGAALEAGAVAAVVERGEGLRVANTIQALQKLAASVRRLWGRRLVAVTGSVGKTTTKEMIAAVLATRFRIHRSEGNLNNQYGLPLSLLKLEESHEAGVFELGMSHAGEIAALARIAQPDTGVVTAVAPVHLEYFPSGIEGIARAKRELIDSLPAGGIAILNADDQFVSRFGDSFEGFQLSFGIDRQADFRACDICEEGDGSQRFRLQWEGEPVEVRLALVGRHNVLNALAALATAQTFGIHPSRAAAALAAFRPLKMRGEILEWNGVRIVNDCYNSNPRALEFLLDTLARAGKGRRRIAVLGEMLELGPASPDLHREAGRRAAAAADCLVAVRGDARYFLEGAAAAGMAAAHLAFFDTPAEAADHLASLLQPGDVVLFKASRGVKLEDAVAKLMNCGLRNADCGVPPKAAGCNPQSQIRDPKSI